MNKNGKKKWARHVKAIVLACIICVTVLNSTVFAAECTEHVWGKVKRVTMVPVYASETLCRHGYIDSHSCVKCGYEETTVVHSEFRAHEVVPYSATCNGKIQTIRGTCSACKHGIVQTKSCPAAPHANGQCTALPLNVQPEELVE